MSKRFQISRRSFLAKCTATAAATGLPLWFVKSQLARAAEADGTPSSSPNSRPGIALIGCGGMGTGDAQSASQYGDIVAVCDVDRNHVDAAARRFTRNGKTPLKFSDFRKALEHPDVQVAVQGTPDHWHTLINLAAARFKKDIYAEKPLTLTIDEGKHLVKAVRDSGIVLQTGSQQRSSIRFRMACELVRNGRLGKLREVDVFVPAGLKEGPFKSAPVPQELDWDFWLGQAPRVDYVRERCHSTFRWWYEYSGGPVTDWGAHHNDIARWGIGENGPQAVDAKILNAPIENGYNTPSEFEATLTWSNDVRQIVRTTRDDSPFGAIINRDGQRNGIKFIGSEGWIWVNRDEITASDDALLKTPLPENAIRLEDSRNHMRNFFDCVGSRKSPICSVEVGHQSAVVGHLIVISLRLGRKFNWDATAERFVGEGAEEGNKHLAREMRKPYDYTFVS